jgi:hypothetical protein
VEYTSCAGRRTNDTAEYVSGELAKPNWGNDCLDKINRMNRIQSCIIPLILSEYFPLGAAAGGTMLKAL